MARGNFKYYGKMETSELLDLLFHDKDPEVRLEVLLEIKRVEETEHNPDNTLVEILTMAEHFLAGMKDNDHRVREAWVLHSMGRINHTREQIYAGYRDDSAHVRMAWLRLNLPADQQDIVELVFDRRADIRKLAVNQYCANKSFNMTDDMLHQGIRDDDDGVAMAWMQANRERVNSLVYTPEDILHGLNHESSKIRYECSKMATPEPGYVDIGIVDDDISVRGRWAMRNDYVPTRKQFEIGTKDDEPEIRHHWVTKDLPFVPTSAQTKEGLDDENDSVAIAWLMRKDFVPTIDEILNGIDQEQDMLACFWIRKASPEFIHKKVALIMGKARAHLKVTLAQIPGVRMTFDQIKEINAIDYLETLTSEYTGDEISWDSDIKDDIMHQLLANAIPEVDLSAPAKSRGRTL